MTSKGVETRRKNGWNKNPILRAERASASLKGRTTTWGAQLSAASKGKPKSEKHKKALSIAQTQLAARLFPLGQRKTYVRGISGNFYSVKNAKTLLYRSSYELAAMQLFEKDSEVLGYEYESLAIPYLDQSQKLHHTIPDYVIHLKDGSSRIVEVKPTYKIALDLHNTKRKLAATKKYALLNSMSFIVLTENELFPNSLN